MQPCCTMSRLKCAWQVCCCHSAFAIRREIAFPGMQAPTAIDPEGSSILDAPKLAVGRLPFSITAFARRQI
jgi:hypothetical protein